MALTIPLPFLNAGSTNKDPKNSTCCVNILNITNGHRLTTYAISSPKHSGEICINGAAAHLIKPKDQVIILSFCAVEEIEKNNFKPKIIKVNKKNKIVLH